jgi:hypothetical protein
VLWEDIGGQARPQPRRAPATLTAREGGRECTVGTRGGATVGGRGAHPRAQARPGHAARRRAGRADGAPRAQAEAKAALAEAVEWPLKYPDQAPPPPHPVLIGHAASLTPY